MQFADTLVPSAGQPHRKLAGLTAAPKVGEARSEGISGCQR